MNKIILVLVLMILGHLIADYVLQGWLGNAKQKSWWEKVAPSPLYKYDYVIALICHCAMWTIITLAPILYFSYENLNWFWLMIPANILFHYVVDDLKANKQKINLITDQALHLIQIILTWLLWVLFIN